MLESDSRDNREIKAPLGSRGIECNGGIDSSHTTVFNPSVVGLIWFVQIIHYPLFKMAGSAEFVDYERCHQQRTTAVVVPLMLTEAFSAVFLVFWRPEGVAGWLPWTGVALVAVV